MAVTAPPVSPDFIRWNSTARPFPATMCAFLHVLRVGAPWASAIDSMASLPDGFLSLDGRFFATAGLHLLFIVFLSNQFACRNRFVPFTIFVLRSLFRITAL